MQVETPPGMHGLAATSRDALYPTSGRRDSWTSSRRHTENKDKDCMICLRPLVKVARCFGVLPISFKDNEIRFEWVSLLTAYAVTVACVLSGYLLFKGSLSILCSDTPCTGGSDSGSVTEADSTTPNVSLQDQGVKLIESAEENSTTPTSPKNETPKKNDFVDTLQDGFFYGFGLSGSLLLLRAAPMVVKLLERWCEVEGGLGSAATIGRRWPLFAGLVVLGLSAAGETIISMIFNEADLPPFWPYLEAYISLGHPQVVEFFGYSKPLGILILLINKYSTFIWNFVDIFIATTAYVLSRHFRAYNRKLQTEAEDCGRRTERWWRGAREQHLAMQELVEATDAITGPLVLQSYICNLFFMLMQLYNSFKPRDNPALIKRIYLAWSFLHLLCRLLFVSFTCACLHSLTLAPTPQLLALPTESVQVEVRRFLQQLQVRQVGLTGWGFFFVNKNFILATTGALVTYEVILLQFSPAAAAPQ